MRHLTLITTGGTIEKTYDEQSGSLENRRSIVDRMVRRLRLEDTSISTIELMSKDSQFMTQEDRETIAETVEAVLVEVDGGEVAAVHGDRVTQVRAPDDPRSIHNEPSRRMLPDGTNLFDNPCEQARLDPRLSVTMTLSRGSLSPHYPSVKAV